MFNSMTLPIDSPNKSLSRVGSAVFSEEKKSRNNEFMGYRRTTADSKYFLKWLWDSC